MRISKFTKTTCSLLILSVVSTLLPAYAGTVKAQKVTSKGALIKWTSDRPYRKTKLRIKCLDNPVNDRVTEPVTRAKLTKEGSKRVKLKPGQKYKITVVGISVKDERKQKPIGFVELKTKGKKLDTSIDDQSKKVKIKAFRNSVRINWVKVSDFKAIKVSIKNNKTEKTRQSGWLRKRNQYTFVKLKRKANFTVRVEGKTEFGQTKLIKEENVKTLK